MFQVFKKVEKQLPQLTTLDLQYVSPSLLKARNLELAVPGNSTRDRVYFHQLTRFRYLPKWKADYHNYELRHQAYSNRLKTTSPATFSQG